MAEITLNNVKEYYGVFSPKDADISPDYEYFVITKGILQGLLFQLENVRLSQDEDEGILYDYKIIGNYGGESIEKVFHENIKYFTELTDLIVVDMIERGCYKLLNEVMPVSGIPSEEDTETQ